MSQHIGRPHSPHRRALELGAAAWTGLTRLRPTAPVIASLALALLLGGSLLALRRSSTGPGTPHTPTAATANAPILGPLAPNAAAAVAPTADRSVASAGVPEATAAPTVASLSAFPAALRRYTVQPGESLIALAARFGVALTALAAANNLSPTADLLIGQVLVLPAEATDVATVSAPVTTATPSVSADTYAVQPGDSLSQLAQRFGIAVTELATLNGLLPTADLLIGEALHILTRSGGSP